MDVITKQERALIDAHLKRRGVTECPPMTFSEKIGVKPWSEFQMRPNRRWRKFAPACVDGDVRRQRALIVTPAWNMPVDMAMKWGRGL